MSGKLDSRLMVSLQALSSNKLPNMPYPGDTIIVAISPNLKIFIKISIIACALPDSPTDNKYTNPLPSLILLAELLQCLFVTKSMEVLFLFDFAFGDE